MGTDKTDDIEESQTIHGSSQDENADESTINEDVDLVEEIMTDETKAERIRQTRELDLLLREKALQLKEADLDLRTKELDISRSESRLNQYIRRYSFVRPASAAFLALFITVVGYFIQSYLNRQLEREKLRGQLIVKAIETGNQESAKRNLLFLIKTGLITDDTGKIGALTPADAPVLPASNNTGVQSVQCRNPPVTATLNYWPVTFTSPAEFCHDYPPLDVRLVDGDYSHNKEEWENGRTAHVGSELYVLVWINNGASDDAERISPGHGIARNVVLTTEVDTDAGKEHYISVRFFGENTNAVASKFRIETADNERLEPVPQSGQVRDYSATKILKDKLEVDNKTISIGNLNPLFSDGVFVRFQIRVVSVNQ
jgi:hypothetical protein